MASIGPMSASASAHVAKLLQFEVSKVYNFTSVIATFAQYRESGRTTELTHVSDVPDSKYTAKVQQENLFQQLHSLEQKGAEPPNAPTEDDAVHQPIHDSIHWVDGRYEADLPWQTTDGKAPFNADLPDSFAYAFGCLQTLIKTLSKLPELLADYDKVVKECLASGIISQVARDSKYTTHYHSHQAVIKTRPVNNGIARTVKTNFSLNDWLNKRTLLLNLITAVRLHSRLASYVLSPDTAKAFLQVSMREEDPQVCLFLWIRDANKPASGEKLVINCINRVIFSLRSSPPLLGAITEHHMEVGDTALSREVLAGCYMDNVYLTADNIEDASDKYRASKFDPLGFFRQEILPARLAVQATCKAKYGWDDPIDTKLLEQWNRAIECWASTEMRVHRLIKQKGHQVSEWHAFCDASGYSYGAAAYLVNAASDGTRSSNVIFSRSRLKALNTNPSIPRLELMAAKLGAPLVDFAQKQLTAKASGTTLWTDSQVVLFWVQSKDKQPVFVENLIHEVRSMNALHNICIKYFPAEDNPAYVLPGGTGASKLQDHPFWWHELSFLGQSDIPFWPVHPTLTEYKDMEFDCGELETFPDVSAQPPNEDSDGSHLEPLCASITDANLHKAYEIDGRVILASSEPIPLLASALHVDKVPAYARKHGLTPPSYTTSSYDQAIGLSYRFADYISVFCRPEAYLSEGHLRRCSDSIDGTLKMRDGGSLWHAHPTIEKRKHQMPAFEGQLTLAKQLERPDRRRYPLAYHLRDHASMNTNVPRDGLEAMAKVKQPEDCHIHSHFWSGDLGQYQRRIEQYSQTLFGINSGHLKRRLTQAQIEFVRTIPLSKVVFESGGQHHGSVGTSQSIGTPAGFIWATTKLKEPVNLPEDVRTIAQKAMGNDLRLYRPCLHIIILPVPDLLEACRSEDRQRAPASSTNSRPVIAQNSHTMLELTAVCDAERVGPHFQCTSVYFVSGGRREDTILSLDRNYVLTGLADIPILRNRKALSAIQLDLCCWAGRLLCDRPQETIRFLHELLGHSALETAAVLDRWYQQILASSGRNFRRVTECDVKHAPRKRFYGGRAAHSLIKKVQPTFRYACQMKTIGLQQEVQDALATVNRVLPDVLADIYQQVSRPFE